MHITAVLLLCLLAWARPSYQYPPSLQRTTGCRCSTPTANETHAFWLQPPQFENPGDTCQRLALQLGHWLDWIDGHTDLKAAWQLYDDILQNRRANAAAPLKHASQSAAQDSAGETPGEGQARVSCQIEDMTESRDGGLMLSDMLVVRVFLGVLILIVLFESFTTIWWSLGRGFSKIFRVRRRGAIRL